MDAILASLTGPEQRIPVRCRMGGDAFVLIEYGAAEFDLALNRYAHAAARAVERAQIPGVRELAPGIRSLLVGFDPFVTTPHRLADALLRVHAELRTEGATIPGRRLVLPLAFDDSTTREAVTRHQSTLGGATCELTSDVEAIQAASHLAGPHEVLAATTEQQWFVAFIGYFPGLPFLLPMSPRPELRAPKLNHPRAWTAEGAVTLGGKCVAIFPVEAPGSYRVFGRTVPIYAHVPVNDSFGGNEMLLRPGDIVTFSPVGENELAEIRRDAFENRYTYRIDEGALIVDGAGATW